MSTEWVVTTSSERIALNAQRQGELTFTVTNQSTRADRAMFDVVAGDGADSSWFHIEEPQRSVRPGASVSYLVKAAIPTQTSAGEYAVQGRVYSADSAPEESSVLSSRIVVAVAGIEPKKKRRIPWWVFVVAALLVIVIAVTVVLIVTNRGEGDVSTVAVPDVSPLSIEEARTVLTDLGLVPQVKYRQDAARPGLVEQTIPAGTRVASGSTVDVLYHVSLKAPVPAAPAAGARFIPPDLPILSWTSPDTYVTSWRVTLIQRTCFYLVAQPNPYACNDLPVIDQVVTKPSYTPAVKFTFRPNATIQGIFHPGLVIWRAQALDDFGNAGPAFADIGYQVG